MPPGAASPTSVMAPESFSLAAVYARAMLELIPDDDEAEDFLRELDALLGLLDDEPQMEQILTAALLTDRQRQELVERVFAGRVSERLESLLGVLARNDRLWLLRPVAGAFTKALHRREGRIDVRVITAVEIGDEARAALADWLGESLGGKPLLTVRTDPTLLGGAVVEVGDRRIDASVAGELERFRDVLRDGRKRVATDESKQSEQTGGETPGEASE